MRYKKPTFYVGPSGGDDRQAALNWQDEELKHEDAGLDAEDDRLTVSQIRAFGTLEQRSSICAVCQGGAQIGDFIIHGICPPHIEERNSKK